MTPAPCKHVAFHSHIGGMSVTACEVYNWSTCYLQLSLVEKRRKEKGREGKEILRREGK